MNVNVIVTTYNYAAYIAHAVDSVLTQTYGHITRVIIIDDGSTDGTADLIDRKYNQNKKIVFVQKDNGGQLSALNYALTHIRDCDVVFFLDADDMYCENYIEEAVHHYKSFRDYDFLFCKRQFFGTVNRIERKYASDSVCGFSVLRTYYLKEWVGNAISMVSMRHDILKKILPFPYENEWKVRADDCLVWGSSLVGAKKYYMDKALVKYRVHQKNYHYGKTCSTDVLFKRQLSINKLFHYIMCKNDVHIDVDKMVLLEFVSIQPRNLSHFFQFVHLLIRANKTFVAQIYYILCFFLYMWRK